jgi:hypothetical protein
MYTLDDVAKTWERWNNNLGREEIYGWPENGGSFLVAPDVKIGEYMYIDLPEGTFIRTTAVVRMELLDE